MAFAQTNRTNFVSSATASSHPVTLGWTATAGRLLIAIVNMDKTISTITDNLSGTWTLDTSAVNFSGLYVYSKVATGGETSVTVTPSTTAGASIVVFEYSGNNGRVTDGANGAVTGTNNTTLATPTLATTNADDLLIVAWGTAGVVGTGETWSSIGPSTSSPTWTLTQQDNSHESAVSGGVNYLHVESGETSTTGSYLATASFSVSYGLGAIIAAYKAAAAFDPSVVPWATVLPRSASLALQGF